MAETSYYRFDEIENDLTNAAKGRRSMFSNEQFAARLKQRLGEALDGKRVLSLDVFDTLVLRDNSSEITRFFEVGGRMAEVVKAETGRVVSQVDAFVARHLGTKATYRASRTVQGCREGSLTELHSTASRLLAGTSVLAEPFIAAELENETARIEPNPFLVDFVRAYRSAGGKVVLVSDMYMHAEHVSMLLDSLGILQEDYDLLVSSADTKVSKASGGIFPLVEGLMEKKPEDFVHLGDSFRGDVAQPLRRGWRAFHLPLAQSDILERQGDHRATQEMLAERHALDIDIAMPS